jgi:hypothetical protein
VRAFSQNIFQRVNHFLNLLETSKNEAKNMQIIKHWLTQHALNSVIMKACSRNQVQQHVSGENVIFQNTSQQVQKEGPDQSASPPIHLLDFFLVPHHHEETNDTSKATAKLLSCS